MKSIVIFSIGIGIGAGIGSGISILALKKKLNREKDEEIEEVRAYYRKKMKENEPKNDEKSGKKEEKSEEKEGSRDEKLSQKVGLAERDTASIGRKKVNEHEVDYTKFYKNSEEYTGKSASELFQYPHEIDEHEFDQDPDYKKIILTYYEENDIIADVQDRPSDYTVEDFGYENMNDFGSDGVKYLRNEKTQTDFKIIYDGTNDFNNVTNGVYLNDE